MNLIAQAPGDPYGEDRSEYTRHIDRAELWLAGDPQVMGAG